MASFGLNFEDEGAKCILFSILVDQLWKIDGPVLENNGNPKYTQIANDKWKVHPLGHIEKDPKRVDKIISGDFIKSKCS